MPTPAPAGDEDEKLLRRYRPVIQYDSHEPYFADFAGVIADRPSNTLRGADGEVLATATKRRPLLKLLSRDVYPDGLGAPGEGDRLSQTGTDHQAQAAEMHARPGYGNRVHGRLAVDAGGTRWLQYWFLMYYDDPGLLGTDAGVHEGDLEMIELSLAGDGTPTTAVYAHHRSGYRVDYEHVQTEETADGPVPVVVSARGSHASMLRSGHQLAGSVVPDHNDGRGPRVRPDVVVLDPQRTPWAWWPGSWGATRAGDGTLSQFGIEANSPVAFCAHRAWNSPSGFAASCDAPRRLPPAGTPMASSELPPPAPRVTAARDGEALRVDYDASAAAAAGADRITVAARPVGSDGPARAVTVRFGADPVGTVRLPVSDAGGHEVHASARRAGGPPSDTVTAADGPRGG